MELIHKSHQCLLWIVQDPRQSYNWCCNPVNNRIHREPTRVPRHRKQGYLDHKTNMPFFSTRAKGKVLIMRMLRWKKQKSHKHNHVINSLAKKSPHVTGRTSAVSRVCNKYWYTCRHRMSMTWMEYDKKKTWSKGHWIPPILKRAIHFPHWPNLT